MDLTYKAEKYVGNECGGREVGHAFFDLLEEDFVQVQNNFELREDSIALLVTNASFVVFLEWLQEMLQENQLAANFTMVKMHFKCYNDLNNMAVII